MSGDLRKLLSLPAGDCVLLLEAAALLPIAFVALRVSPRWFLRARSAASRTKSPSRRTAGGRNPERIAWAVRAVASRLGRWPTCLVAATAGQLLLRAHGHEPQLRIGVRPCAMRVHAHAWVECGGAVVLGQLPELESFAPLTGY